MANSLCASSLFKKLLWVTFLHPEGKHNLISKNLEFDIIVLWWSFPTEKPAGGCAIVTVLLRTPHQPPLLISLLSRDVPEAPNPYIFFRFQTKPEALVWSFSWYPSLISLAAILCLILPWSAGAIYQASEGLTGKLSTVDWMGDRSGSQDAGQGGSIQQTVTDRCTEISLAC